MPSRSGWRSNRPRQTETRRPPPRTLAVTCRSWPQIVPGLDDVARPARGERRTARGCSRRPARRAPGRLDSPSSISASTRKLRIMKPPPAASIGPPIPSSRRMPWPHNVVSATRSSRISSKVRTFEMRGERQGDRQVVPEARAQDPSSGRACAASSSAAASRAQDRPRVDEPGDRDGVLAGPVGPQARVGDLGRRADARSRRRRRCPGAPGPRRRPSRPAPRAARRARTPRRGRGRPWPASTRSRPGTPATAGSGPASTMTRPACPVAQPPPRSCPSRSLRP